MSAAAQSEAPTRPVLRYHGGKWKLAPWIIAQFPPDRVYVEPFGGAASVLLRKPRAYAEIYNDLDGDVVNLFRVLRGPRAGELVELLRLTPFARGEFKAAYEAADDPVERARRLVVRSYMGFGSPSSNVKVSAGFRANSNRSSTTPAHDWANYPDTLAGIIERLRRVVIECRAAADVMVQHDGSDTLHYIDPPYLPETRSAKLRKGLGKRGAYAHEMTAADHEELLESLLVLRGMVVLSGYPSALYDDALADWTRLERRALADGARERTEVLWINRAAAAGHGLFSAAQGAGGS